MDSFDIQSKKEMIAFLYELRRSMYESFNMINHVIAYLENSCDRKKSRIRRFISWVKHEKL